MDVLTDILFLVPSVFLVALWRGFVLSVLWGWFIVPFFGLSPISVPLGAGLSLMIAVLTDTFIPLRDEDRVETIRYACFAGIIMPTIHLLLAWIVRLFLY